MTTYLNNPTIFFHQFSLTTISDLVHFLNQEKVKTPLEGKIYPKTVTKYDLCYQ